MLQRNKMFRSKSNSNVFWWLHVWFTVGVFCMKANDSVPNELSAVYVKLKGSYIVKFQSEVEICVLYLCLYVHWRIAFALLLVTIFCSLC